MFVHIGKGLYGKTDHVEGLFYVATQFVHISGLPFIPLASYLVVDGSQKGKKFNGQRIPMQWKSVLLGYSRAWFGALSVMLAIAGFACALDLSARIGHPPGFWFLPALILLVVLLVVAMLHRSIFGSLLLAIFVIGGLELLFEVPKLLARFPALQPKADVAWGAALLLNLSAWLAMLVRFTHVWYPARRDRARQLGELVGLPQETMDELFPERTEAGSI